MKYLFIFLIIFFAFPVSVGFSEEQKQNKGSDVTQDFEGNKICPVYADGRQPTEEKFSYEYEGKTVYFCCPLCIEYFQKNPERFMKKLKKHNKKIKKKEKNNEIK